MFSRDPFAGADTTIRVSASIRKTPDPRLTSAGIGTRSSGVSVCAEHAGTPVESNNTAKKDLNFFSIRVDQPILVTTLTGGYEGS